MKVKVAYKRLHTIHHLLAA